MTGLTLAIDTATEACSAALIGDAGIVARMSAIVGRGHAERLVPMVETLLRNAGAARPTAILVDCGPGSFTGVRVGLAAAIGMGIGWGVPVRGYRSLDVIAAALFDAEPVLDACAVALTGGHGELFVQRFARRDGAAGPAVTLSPEDAARLIGETVIAGSGAALLLAARGHGDARAMLPDAADARLLPDALLIAATPIYGRAPDAKPRAA